MAVTCCAQAVALWAENKIADVMAIVWTLPSSPVSDDMCYWNRLTDLISKQSKLTTSC